jgi:hypothetical protein
MTCWSSAALAAAPQRNNAAHRDLFPSEASPPPKGSRRARQRRGSAERVRPDAPRVDNQAIDAATVLVVRRRPRSCGAATVRANDHVVSDEREQFRCGIRRDGRGHGEMMRGRQAAGRARKPHEDHQGRAGSFGSTTFLALSAPVTGNPFGSSSPTCTRTPAWSQ